MPSTKNVLNSPLRRRCPRVAEALAEAQALAQALEAGVQF